MRKQIQTMRAADLRTALLDQALPVLGSRLCPTAAGCLPLTLHCLATSVLLPWD